MFVQNVVNIFIARQLLPDDYALIAILMIFVYIAQGIADGGFSQTLIRKKEPTRQEYSSVFYINIAVSVVLYVALLALMGPISKLYDEPSLRIYAPWLFAFIPINALGLIQMTVIIKEMRFRISAGINLFATVVTGAVALVMVYNGWGIWSLVVMNVGKEALKVGLMWGWNRWMPELSFSFRAVREMFSFGVKLMAMNMVTNVAANAAQFIIGKVYAKSSLGLFDKAQKTRDNFTLVMLQSVANVTYPALAQLQDEKEKLRGAASKVIVMMNFALTPIIAGLIAVAGELFTLVMGAQWAGATNYFIIFCASAIFLPGSYVATNVLKVAGRGGLLLKIELGKRAAMLAMILATAFISVMAVVWAMAAYALLDIVVNLWFIRKEIGYTFSDYLRDSTPYFALSAVMCGLVLLAGYLLAPIIGAWWLLGLKIVLGGGIYLLLTKLFRTEAWGEAREIMGQYRQKISGAIGSRKQPFDL